MNIKRLNILLMLLLLVMIIICSSIVVNNVIPVTTFGEEYSSAKAMSVIEANSGRELLSKNSDKELAMASTTKIMTALVAIENTPDLDKVVNIDKRAIGIEGTSIYLTDKENLTMRELLYGLMLASGNDASVAIASEVTNGDIDLFIEMMNKKAQEIGANHTHFANTHGLDAKNHYTSAHDLAVITSCAIKNPVFKEIVSTKRTTIAGNDKVEKRYLKNKEKLLNTYEGCIGVKTGFTDNAGRCNVTAVEKDNMLVICVVLNCPDMFEESARLLDEVFEKYTNEIVLPIGYIQTQVTVNGGKCEKVNVFNKKEFNYPLTNIEKSLIIIESDLPDELEAPIEKDSAIGTIMVKLNDQIIFSDSIYTMDSVEKQIIRTEIEDIIDNWAY